jgi:hypothetical protein
MKISAATTFSLKGYALYGHKLIDTFYKFWPNYINLYVYYDAKPDSGWHTTSPNIHYIPLDMADLNAFKIRNSGNPKQSSKNFLCDGIRFSHKVFAYVDACLNKGDDIVVWLDGDVITHRRVDENIVLKWLNGKMAGALFRPWMYTETGFHVFDMRYPQAREFMTIWREQYTNDHIWNLPGPTPKHKYLGYTDCHTYDHVRTGFSSDLWYNLSPASVKSQHPFVNGMLGEHMDHCKGDRKKAGRSRQADLQVKRNEAYWRNK